MRTKAVGKFMQGISYGYLGLYFDKAFVIDEKVDLDTLTNPQFKTYKEVRRPASRRSTPRIAVAAQANFTLPLDGWLYTDDDAGPVRPARQLVCGAAAGVLGAYARRARRGGLDRGHHAR